MKLIKAGDRAKMTVTVLSVNGEQLSEDNTIGLEVNASNPKENSHDSLEDFLSHEIVGLKTGEEKTFDIDSNLMFPPYDDNLITEIKRSEIPQKIEKGNILETDDGLFGEVIEIDDEVIVADFNHPFSGTQLNIHLKIQSINS